MNTTRLVKHSNMSNIRTGSCWSSVAWNKHANGVQIESGPNAVGGWCWWVGEVVRCVEWVGLGTQRLCALSPGGFASVSCVAQLGQCTGGAWFRSGFVIWFGWLDEHFDDRLCMFLCFTQASSLSVLGGLLSFSWWCFTLAWQWHPLLGCLISYSRLFGLSCFSWWRNLMHVVLWFTCAFVIWMSGSDLVNLYWRWGVVHKWAIISLHVDILSCSCAWTMCGFVVVGHIFDRSQCVLGFVRFCFSLFVGRDGIVPAKLSSIINMCQCCRLFRVWFRVTLPVACVFCGLLLMELQLPCAT